METKIIQAIANTEQAFNDYFVGLITEKKFRITADRLKKLLLEKSSLNSNEENLEILNALEAMKERTINKRKKELSIATYKLVEGINKIEGNVNELSEMDEVGNLL